MVRSSVLAFSTDGEHLMYGGFSLGETIHLGSFELIADYFGSLSLSPRRSDSGTAFMSSTRSGPPHPRWAMIEDSIEEFHTISSRGGDSNLPSPRRLGAGALPAPVTTILCRRTHSSGGAMSACPRLATQRRAGDGAATEQAHWQADNGRGPIARAATTRSRT
jgi:hypothetical protein